MNKTVCITGASRGLGRAAASLFYTLGWDVAIISRNEAALHATAEELEAGPGNGHIIPIACDLEHRGEARNIFTRLQSAWPKLDALVNNAGIQGPIGALWENDPMEWERAFRTLLFTPVELCREAIPWMGRHGGGSIVNVSGGGATGPRPFFSAYGAAKTALVRLTETLAAECAHLSIRVNAVAPGAMPTAMLAEVAAAGPDKAGEKEFQNAVRIAENDSGEVMKRAARCIFSLCSPESGGTTGRLISAVWDPWPELAAHEEEIAGSDIYTLRRIVPKDRGKAWGND